MIGPVVAVAVVLCALIATRLVVYDGNVTGFIQFGQQTIHYSNPPAGAVVATPEGYDGQFYWIQANDPLLLHDATVTRVRETAPGYHLQRPAYPALAWLLAAGQRDAIPWTMLIANVLVVLALTAYFAVYARGRGWSPWWAFVLGAMPGFMLATLRDLSDPLAVATMLVGLLAWQAGRRWPAAILLAVAALAREPMTVAVVAVAIDALVSWVRSRRQPGALRRAIGQVWPVLVLPTAAFFGWQLYVAARYGGGAGTTSVGGGVAGGVPTPPTLIPFNDFVNEFRTATSHLTSSSFWDLIFLALTLAGMGAAVLLLWRRPRATSIAAVLFAITLTVIVFGDQWGDSRYALPMFAVLVPEALEQRSERTLLICVAVVALTFLAPIAVPRA